VRFAIADPPYPGQSSKHYRNHKDFAGEVDHRELVERLINDFDGWALHTSAPALYLCQSHLAEQGLFSMDPGTFKGGDYRVFAWVKPFASYKRNVKVAYTWEPVLVKGLRPAEPNRIEGIVSRDHLIEAENEELLAELAIPEPITMRRGLTGAKPERVCHWLFEVAGLLPEDEFHDLYPGSGAVTRAYESWCAAPQLAEISGGGLLSDDRG
jgi:hypothetical protein